MSPFLFVENRLRPADMPVRRSALFAIWLLTGLLWPAAGIAQEPGTETVPAQTEAPPPQPEAESAGQTPAGPSSVLEPEMVLEPLPGISASEMDEIRSSLSGEGGETAENGEKSAADGLDADNAAKPPFRIGIVPRGDANHFVKRLRPLQEGLGDLLGRPVEILPMTSFSAMINAHTLRRIDLGFYSASAFVAADRLCRCVEPLVKPLADDGTSAFHAVIVTRQDSNIRTIGDLEGKRIAASSFDSIGGYRIQMASLVRDGIDVGSYFKQIGMAGSGAGALLQVRDGIADAAFVWSSMTGPLASGYSRGPLAYLVRTGEIDMAEMSIIWQSKPIAHAPVVGLKSFTAEEREAVRTYLLALPESDIATYDLLDVFYGGGFKVADIDDFRGIGILADVDLRTPRAGGSIQTGSTAKPKIPVPRLRPDPQSLPQTLAQ